MFQRKLQYLKYKMNEYRFYRIFFRILHFKIDFGIIILFIACIYYYYYVPSIIRNSIRHYDTLIGPIEKIVSLLNAVDYYIILSYNNYS